MDFWPCAGQTPDCIRDYYGQADVGAVAVVRETQGHFLLYKITEVTGQNPARGRVYVQSDGAFYTKHGKNCFHPKGQTTLVVPTPEVLEWAARYPLGAPAYDRAAFPA